MDEVFFSSKSGETSFLSNFYPCTVKIDGKTYNSVEQYYQSCRVLNPELAQWVANSPSALYAKLVIESLKQTRPKDLVEGWYDIKLRIMKKAIRAKFTQNQELKEKLLETGTSILHEDVKGEDFWGIEGEDMLGKMLMELREELKGK